MSVEEKQPEQETKKHGRERGQSLVLIAFLLIVMLGFTGLAVDVGFIWLRGSQLTKAVDAAALAGASALGDGIGNTIVDADQAARSFLFVNDVPAEVVDDEVNLVNNVPGTLRSAQGASLIGARTYQITVTWPVELFFLRVLSFDEVELTRTATAAYFPLVDIYASRRVDSGVINTSTQSIFGPNICTSFGDPFTPDRRGNGSPNPWSWYLNDTDTYQYRIAVPADYEARTGQSIVRVELFDPDTYNRPAPSNTTIIHSDLYANENGTVSTNTTSCSNNGQRHNACLIQTCEWDGQNCGGVDQFGLDDINPFWFIRIDENRGRGATPGNNTCGGPDGGYNNGYNTQTRYTLYYFKQESDGTINRVDLSSYTGQTFDPTRDFDVEGGAVLGHGSDLHWISPGGPNTVQSYDAGTAEWGNNLDATVPTDCGSATGGYSRFGDDTRPEADRRCGADPYSPPAEGRGFEIDLSTHTDNILVDPNTGVRYIYLDIWAMSGASENDFEVWAGPPYNPDDYGGIIRPSEVNLRNLFHVDNPGIHNSAGVAVYALGTLPINSLFNNTVEIPLIYVGPEYAGREIQISLFDPDSGTVPPITFFFDTIAEADYSVPFNSFNCNGSCNDGWVGDINGGGSDPFSVLVPDFTEECTDPTDASQASVCTPFYGGNLYLRYQAGSGDTYRWLITLPSLPYLID